MTALKFIQKNAWWLASAVYAVVIIIYSATPVFWDMYGQIKTSYYYLETGFEHLFPSGSGITDNGHFPLYSLYLAILFKVFGFKLWLAHLSVIPFIMGLFYQLQMLCNRFLPDKRTLWVMALTCIHPALIAQSIYFSSEIAFVFFGLWMLNTIKDVRPSRMVLSSSLLCLLNLRAFPIILVMLFYFVFYKKQKSAWYLLCSILIYVAWMFISFYIKGWFFMNPENISHRTVLGFKGMLYNLFWCFIKLTDFGNIVALLFIALFCFKEKKTDEPILFLLLISVAIMTSCIPLSNPISNRYFLLVYVLSIPAYIYAVSSFCIKKLMATCFIFVLFMIQSNWFTYPNKYGNAWDCKLRSLNYFAVRKELDEYIAENHISSKDVAAGFQVYFNDAYYLMNGSAKEYDLLSDTEMNENLYIANSNICNNYNAQRKDYLEKNYTLLKDFQKAGIYIKLYRRK